MKTKFLTVGSDPEVALRNNKGDLVSAIGIIPGTKWNPLKTKHGAISYDNITAEFNSIPSNNLKDFILNHKLIIQDLTDFIKPLDLHLDYIASAMCSDELLSDPLSRIAGCEPDFNAWSLSINDPPSYQFSSLRAYGGHVHIAFDQAVGSEENRIKFIRALDMVLGVPSIIIDNDKLRREYYGKAGSFRPKDTINFDPDIGPDPYDGVEYRTLSNFWLKSDDLMGFIWNGVEKVYNNLDELSEKALYLKDSVVSIINSGNRDRAKLFCTMENIDVGF